MKAKLLKKFRKRFTVGQLGENSFVLFDHKNQRAIYKAHTFQGNIVFTELKIAVFYGCALITGPFQAEEYIKTRKKRVYKSLIAQTKYEKAKI